MIETKRLILRPWRLEDAEALFPDAAMGPLGCAVHFLDYSAVRVGCIRFGIANGGLRMSLVSVFEPDFNVFRSKGASFSLYRDPK